MIRSMTGFGAATGSVGSQRVTVEMRTVNHRFFNPHVKLPPSLSRWEAEVREQLRRAIARGHVTLTARTEREAGAALSIDEERFAGYVEQLRALQKRHGLSGELGVGTVLRMPELFAGGVAEEAPDTPDELTALVASALDALTQMREAEGARLAQEIAILADRLDVSEEIDRFRSHVQEFRAALRKSSREPVGKRLGFLLQEMLREANTTGSKARDAVMMHHVVAMKEELERIAEQVENVE